MKSKILFVVALCVLAYGATASAAVVNVDPGAQWLGYMNVYEIPANGGNYVFGSPWGVADLTAVFNPSGSTTPNLQLGPNSVNDTNAFWYTPSGQPGATGNKITDANVYVENNTFATTDSSVTFMGNVVSNTFTSTSYTTVAFIREFDQNYQLIKSAQTPNPLIDDNTSVIPGAFSVSMNLIPAPTGVTYHVQYGFDTKGPDVWVTDRGPVGLVTVTTLPGDVNRDGHINAGDITAIQNEMAIGPAAYAAQLGYFNAGPPSLAALNAAIAQVTNSGDMNADGVLNGADIQKLISYIKAGNGTLASVPEPSSLVLLALAGLGLAAAKKRLSA